MEQFLLSKFKKSNPCSISLIINYPILLIFNISISPCAKGYFMERRKILRILETANELIAIAKEMEGETLSSSELV